MRANDDDQNAIYPEQPRAQRGEHQIDPGDPHFGAHAFAQIVRPKALPPPLDAERFDARYPAQRFDEMAVLLRSEHDCFLIGRQ